MGPAAQGMAPATTSAGPAMLRLIAQVMDSSFAIVGEGVVLGTMPGYLERFGQRHAEHLSRRFVKCDPATGADAALAPLNLLSGITGTSFDMVRSEAAHATKRLMACEFAPAFADKSPFTKAMVCQLHRAAYQGAVNAGVPAESGYDVALNSRILFGGTHCDFDVVSRIPRAGTGQAPQVVLVPSAAQAAAESATFYAAILAAFLEYLGTLLPAADVEALLADCITRSGTTAQEVLGPGTGSLVERVRRLAEVT